MKTDLVEIETPKDCNCILLTSHFIKTVEDLYETLVQAVPGIKFGLAFCEASGKCLIRKAGTDTELVSAAVRAAEKLSAGHSAIIFLKSYPVNVLNAIKQVSEVCTIHAATANALRIVIADDGKGRGILGVIDGEKPKGTENEADEKDRKDFLRKIGYKL
ncbi:MAG: adenosine-specific kinase [Candidatus Aenigmarchaeota archaeon]|nr:adenosine-specific kinase [Candidatus Aenigmarchaeota archaeon]